MAQAATQRTTGNTRVRGPMIVTLRGASSKGNENKYGGVTAKGVGLDVGLSVQVPSGQSANSFQVEQPDGTVISALDSSCNLSLSGNTGSKLCQIMVPIPSADITSTSAGKFGHANGETLVAAPGAGFALEFVSAVMSYTFATAAYTGGGNVTINWGAGGAAITGLISAASSIGAGSSNITQFVPLSTVGFAVSSNTALSLVAASAFTQPGTAAGTIKVFLTYRVHTL